MSTVQDFYDGLAESYHLIFEDWDRSIDRQGAALADVLARWSLPTRCVLDAAVGIGTQALGLAARGFHLTGSDVSTGALVRAQREAGGRHLALALAAADFRWLPFRAGSADVAIACDNALPHLLSLHDIRAALLEFKRCVRAGGGFVLSMRDYSVPPPPGTVEHHPYGERVWGGRRFLAEQEWRWDGPTYRVVLRIRPLEHAADAKVVEVETTYLAVAVSAILELMSDVGCTDVQRVDGVYYQPLLLGTAPGAA